MSESGDIENSSDGGSAKNETRSVSNYSADDNADEYCNPRFDANNTGSEGRYEPEVGIPQTAENFYASIDDEPGRFVEDDTYDNRNLNVEPDVDDRSEDNGLYSEIRHEQEVVEDNKEEEEEEEDERINREEEEEQEEEERNIAESDEDVPDHVAAAAVQSLSAGEVYDDVVVSEASVTYEDQDCVWIRTRSTDQPRRPGRVWTGTG